MTRKGYPEEVAMEREGHAELQLHFKSAAGRSAASAKALRQDQACLVKEAACLLPRIPRENKNL